MKATKLLIIDDDQYSCEVLRDNFELEGYVTQTAYSGRQGLDEFSKNAYDLILLDIKMSDIDGIQVLKEIRKVNNNVAIIMITGVHEVATVVEAIKEGADDYLVKPFQDLSIVQSAIEKALRYKSIKDENVQLKKRLASLSSAQSLIASSSSMQELLRMIRKVAPLQTTVLLIGETGTGKEVIASTIHHYSKRRENKFISINCGGIPETLLESTLFGYEKGAFTGAYKQTTGIFEEADGGTLFLDEIGEMSPTLQVRLLRVLQEQIFHRVGGTQKIKTDTRIISATNKDLQEEVKADNFREDLYYRLNVVTLYIPPLRDRKADIEPLANYFLKKYRALHDKTVKNIKDSVLNCLRKYDWPGNVRELENTIEHAVVFCEQDNITCSDLPAQMTASARPSASAPTIRKFQKAKTEFEKDYLITLLTKCQGNITKAAQLSGIRRQNIYQKLKKYKLKS